MHSHWLLHRVNCRPRGGRQTGGNRRPVVCLFLLLIKFSNDRLSKFTMVTSFALVQNLA